MGSVWRAAALWVWVWIGVASVGCAHRPGGESWLGTIDFVDETGASRTLAPSLGQVVVLDVCMASIGGCLFNARSISEACEVFCDRGVAMYSLLLDDLGETAAGTYRDKLGFKQTVGVAGERLRSGQSALGLVNALPRTVLLDQEGRVLEDVAGQVIQGVVLSAKIDDLL